MHARKWISNSTKVLEQVPSKDRADGVEILEKCLPEVKILVVQWLPQNDQFTFTVSNNEEKGNITKTMVLNRISTLFDPLGFLAPYIIQGNMIMQEVWLHRLEWNDRLEEDLRYKLIAWYNKLEQISEIKVPRCLQMNLEKQKVLLHVFSNASEEVYAAMAYLNVKYQDSSRRLVVVKAKVALLEATRTPRLKFIAAVLAVKLAIPMKKVLETPEKKIYYWIDSRNVLWWIKNRSCALKTFVGNRIAKIQKESSPTKWNYVKTDDNPADVPSKGLLAQDLKESKLWWCEAEFLQYEEDIGQSQE